MDWKGIVEKIIAGVGITILLAMLAWLWTAVTAPPASPVVVTARWVDIPNPAFRIDRSQIRDIDAALSRAFGVTDLASFLRDLGFRSTGRLVVVQLHNILNHRSKAIEIAAKDAAIFSPGAPRSSAVRSQLRIDSIDPGKSIAVYLAMPPWLSFHKPPIDVLHDGTRLDVVAIPMQFEADEHRYEPISADVFLAVASSYPFLIGIFFLIGVLACVIMVVSLSAQLLFAGPLKNLQAKYASKEYVKQQIDFIERVRTLNPKNLPDADGSKEKENDVPA